MTSTIAATTTQVDAEDVTPREREILAVCAELLTEIGYERLTIDAVAARARASKATIYRRWPGKPALVTAAVRHLNEEPFSVTYTGDLRTDLLTLLHDLRDGLTERGALLAGMVSAMQQDPELAGLMRADIKQCQSVTASLLNRYAEDGAIRNPDAELIRQLATATVLTRLLFTGETVDDDVLARLVDNVLIPLLTLTLPPGA
ncbi:TetR/AcrR family transcriptional regulator [Sporichthya brevicatena]|uniref:TetR/AcrR family transcriptional regulator n=1 Tax=Sporichthya brevicatena TaxID=171442 RepID=A0ABN1H116_9ACTN